MTDFFARFGGRRIGFLIGGVVMLTVGTVLLALEVPKSRLSRQLKELTEEKRALSDEAQKMQKLLKEKEDALATASRKNFQADLQTAQAALKDANEKFSVAMQEKVTIENSNAVLNGRLKNTTQELTRTLEELKKARETLNGIEGQYKVKITQLNETIKNKETQLQRFQDSMKNQEGASVDLQKKGREYADALRQNQAQIAELQKTVVSVNKALADKDREIEVQRSEISQLRKEAVGFARGRGQENAGVKLAKLEQDKAELERQVSESSAKVFDQQERLKDLERKVSALNDTLSQREMVLLQKDKELKKNAREVMALKEEMENLSLSASSASKSVPLLSESQKILQSKVRQLQEEKNSLEERLREMEALSLSQKTANDTGFDRSSRVLTDALAKKDRQIRQLQAEVEKLLEEKSVEGSSSGDNKRMAELQSLVTTLTKQLGEYATMIEKRDAELRAGAEKIALLMQQIDSQKSASLSLERELEDARVRQEKTFQVLTQFMSLNANTASVGAPRVSYPDVQAEYTEKLDTASDLPEDTDSSNVRKRVDDLKRQVEVLLEK